MSIRLFAALELPGDARRALAAWGARAGDGDPALRPLGADALHLTLAFLGSQDESAVEAIGAAMIAEARPLPPLCVTGEAWLPPRRPGVLAADLDAPGELLALQASVAAALARWRDPDRRTFRPHVTVARVRRGGPPRRTAPPPAPRLRLAVGPLTLFRSLPRPGGAVYEALASAPR